MKCLLIFLSLLIKINNLITESFNLTEIYLNGAKDLEFVIFPNIIYKFTIENEKNVNRFPKRDDIVYDYNNKASNNFLQVNDSLYFAKGSVIFAKYSSNLKHTNKIKISSIPLYSELNSLETINENQKFYIMSNEESYLYLDSIENNCKINITDEKGSIGPINIAGIFIDIMPEKLYLVQVEIYDICVLRQYLYPRNLNKEINIKNGEKFFLYLKGGQTTILNFEGNTMNKILKLSEKTLNAKVSIYKDDVEIFSLNQSQKYYEIPENYEDKLSLISDKEFAFIEFLSQGNSEILEDISLNNYQLKGNHINIKLNPTQKSFKIQLNSDKIIKLSLSFCISNKNNFYFISNSNIAINSQKKELLLIYLAPFKYLDLLKNEFLFININFEREDNTQLNISYNQFSEIDKLFNEKLSSQDCNEIIHYLSMIFELYVYTDIAKNPPKINGYQNYHHKKIDLIKEIKNINTENRQFYEFYQEIQKILTSSKDCHLEINCQIINILFYFNYHYYLLFNFIIGEYEGKNRIFIQKNNYFNKFNSDIQKIIESHLNIPLKMINGIDPFDYIQNWSQFKSSKNLHAQFTRILDVLSDFNLANYPIYYQNVTLNDYGFEDGTILRLNYQLRQVFLNENSNINELKDIKTEKEMTETNINWDIIYDNNNKYFKCRVDNVHKANVFVQNSFSVSGGKFREAKVKIIQCAKLFHTNKYPIIIIESKNTGGNPILASLMIQLFQMREVERAYSSIRLSNTASLFYQNRTFTL